LGKRPSVPSERTVLIDSVTEHHRRLRNVIAQVFMNSSVEGVHNGRRAAVYLVNGDHNHMTSAIEGVLVGTKQKPIVVYIDLHADSRPLEDGPHSGTWCSEAFANKWVDKVFRNSFHLNREKVDVCIVAGVPCWVESIGEFWENN
jgi:arginase family enzyme